MRDLAGARDRAAKFAATLGSGLHDGDPARGRVQGMLPVNAATGAVWPHGWHGRFLQISEGS